MEPPLLPPDPVIKKVSLIGCGRAGFHLGKWLHEKGLHLEQVYNRSAGPAQELCNLTCSRFTDQLSDLLPGSDLYLIAVSDSAIEGLAAQLHHLHPELDRVAHISGSTSSQVLASNFGKSGVFYPLQSFSPNRSLAYEEISVCVHSENIPFENRLFDLATKMSARPYRLDDAHRAVLHLAAVFANNFTNFCYLASHEILEDAQLPFDLLRPLIAETAAKVQDQLPEAMQTGPARRGDWNTLLKQEKYLEKFPEFKFLYSAISKAIQKQFNS